MDDFKKFIENNSDEISYMGGISLEKVQYIENKLDVNLNTDYREFLLNFGMVIGYGWEFIGCGKADEPPVVLETL